MKFQKEFWDGADATGDRTILRMKSLFTTNPHKNEQFQK